MRKVIRNILIVLVVVMLSPFAGELDCCGDHHDSQADCPCVLCGTSSFTCHDEISYAIPRIAQRTSTPASQWSEPLLIADIFRPPNFI